MRSPSSSLHTCFCVVSATLLALLAGCAAPHTGETTVSSADVASAPAERPAEPPPPGERVCKARTPEHGTVELFLEGNGPVRKGFLRTTVPSGMVHVQTVRAERYDDLLVADDVLSTDLVVHAATLRRRGAAQEIKLGEWKQRWSTCE